MNTDLSQALMTTVTENSQPTYVLIANAGRLAHSMGLHQIRREPEGFSREVEQRQQHIFWVIYILEKGICLRCDRPSMIHDDDIGIPLPAVPSHREEVFFDAKGRLVFRALSQLAYLESRTYNHMLSAKARTQSAEELLRRAKILNDKLRSWSQSLPTMIKPTLQHSLKLEQPLHACMQQLAYQHCRIALNQSVPPTHGQEAKVGPENWLQSAICVSAARSMLQPLRDVIHNSNRAPGQVPWPSPKPSILTIVRDPIMSLTILLSFRQVHLMI